MKKIFKTELTETELRQLIREEVTAALSIEPGGAGNTDQESFINVSQAAEFTKLKTGSLYNLVNKNKIPFHKSGKRVLFKKSELAVWVQGKNNK